MKKNSRYVLNLNILWQSSSFAWVMFVIWGASCQITVCQNNGQTSSSNQSVMSHNINISSVFFVLCLLTFWFLKITSVFWNVLFCFFVILFFVLLLSFPFFLLILTQRKAFQQSYFCCVKSHLPHEEVFFIVKVQVMSQRLHSPQIVWYMIFLSSAVNKWCMVHFQLHPATHCHVRRRRTCCPLLGSITSATLAIWTVCYR